MLRQCLIKALLLISPLQGHDVLGERRWRVTLRSLHTVLNVKK